MVERKGNRIMNIPIDRVLVNPEQPRVHFDQNELLELADSILIHGVIQPIVVEPAGDDYILHDGERRWRAAKLAGLVEIPVVFAQAQNGSRRGRLERALVANLQRADLNPIEEARAYRRLREEFGLMNTEIARRLGVSDVRVSARLVLLDLEPEIQELIAEGRLPRDGNAARAMLEIPDPQARIQLAQKAADLGMSLRSIKASAGRIASILNKKKEIGAGDTPGLVFSSSQPGRAPLPDWDALAQAGKVPRWEAVVKATRGTCRECNLRDIAKQEICEPCPVPNLIVKLIHEARK
jgi:ParB family chromosome partitioning protein